MGYPLPGQTHIDQALTDLSIGTFTEPSDFIGDLICPIIPVTKRSNKYFVYSQADLLRIVAQRRAPATESVGGDYELSTDSYFAERYSLHMDIADEDRDGEDDAIDADADATDYVVQNLRMKREKLIADAFFTTGIWTGDQTGVSGSPSTNQFKQWDASGSIPIENIRAFQGVLKGRTGYRANTLVLGWQVRDALLDNSDITSRIQYTTAVTPRAVMGMLAELFGVDRVLVAESSYNTANKGATASYSPIIGKVAWLGYVNPNPGRRRPSAAYTFSFSYSKYDRVRQSGAPAIKRIRLENIEADRIEGDIYIAPKVVAPDMGVFLTAAVG